MPNQNDPTQNPNPANQATNPTTPPVIFPQPDLPPLLPEFQNLPKNDIPVPSPVNPPNDKPDGPEASQPDNDGGSSTPPDISSVIPKAKKKFGGGKIIATILGLIVLVGGVGAGILLTQQPQLFQQKAKLACEDDSECSAGWKCVSGGCLKVPTSICTIGQNEDAGCTNTLNGQSCPGKKTRFCQNGQWGSYSACSDIADSCPTTTTTADDSKCSGIINGSTTLGVGSLYPTCYINHYWCQTKKPGGCSDQLIGNAVQSASFTKSCGTEQIDLHCPLCPKYISGKTNILNGQLFISKIYPNECSTSTTPPSPTPTPTPGAPSCISVKAYDNGWNALTNAQLSALTVGDIVNFCTNGNANTGTFDKAQFMVNTVLKPETTTKRPSSNDFCQPYTILSTDTTVSVRAKIHHSSGVWVGESI